MGILSEFRLWGSFLKGSYQELRLCDGMRLRLSFPSPRPSLQRGVVRTFDPSRPIKVGVQPDLRAISRSQYKSIFLHGATKKGSLPSLVSVGMQSLDP